MAARKAGIARYRKLLWMVGLSLGLIVLLLAGSGQQMSTEATSQQEIGVGPPGSNAYQFAGHIDQDGAFFTGYGYVYDVEGLSPADLFTDPFNTSPATAHITYYATATLTSRAVVTDATRSIFALDSEGQITFYFQSTPAADWAYPASFAGGTPIATASVSLQDILNVQAPNRGIAVGNGEFTVESADTFELNGETLQFTRPGLTYRIFTTGEGLRTDAGIPQSSVLLAGNAVTPGRWQTFLPNVLARYTQ
jgi:hypothetical protein